MDYNQREGWGNTATLSTLLSILEDTVVYYTVCSLKMQQSIN